MFSMWCSMFIISLICSGCCDVLLFLWQVQSFLFCAFSVSFVWPGNRVWFSTQVSRSSWQSRQLKRVCNECPSKRGISVKYHLKKSKMGLNSSTTFVAVTSLFKSVLGPSHRFFKAVGRTAPPYRHTKVRVVKVVRSVKALARLFGKLKPDWKGGGDGTVKVNFASFFSKWLGFLWFKFK